MMHVCISSNVRWQCPCVPLAEGMNLQESERGGVDGCESSKRGGKNEKKEGVTRCKAGNRQGGAIEEERERGKKGRGERREERRRRGERAEWGVGGDFEDL